MALTPRRPPSPRAAVRAPRPDVTLRIRIHPGIVASVYSAVSRDVSAGAPQASRVELRDANESDFTDAGTAEPGTQVPMPQWHRGITN